MKYPYEQYIERSKRWLVAVRHVREKVCVIHPNIMLYRLPFIVYAVMSKEELLSKIKSVGGSTVECVDISYTSRCEVFVPPKLERLSCKALESLSDVTVDCYGKYE